MLVYDYNRPISTANKSSGEPADHDRGGAACVAYTRVAFAGIACVAFPRVAFTCARAEIPLIEASRQLRRPMD